MRLFADPSLLDCSGQQPERGVGRQIGQIVFPFSGGTVLANQPDFITGHIEMDPSVRTVLWA